MPRRPVVAAFGLAVLIAGCSQPLPPPPPAGGGRQVDAATAGALTGRISFTGPAPAVERLRMGTDQACVQAAGPNPQSDAVLIAADGGLKNVFVHLKAGVDDAYSFEIPAEAAVLDQRGCFYTPRVLGVRAGQPIRILNSDQTLHNVHALPRHNLEFNKSTPVQGSSTTQTFTVPEVMVRFKCDVHGWMAAWVGVVAHPFFAVTDEAGAFDIRGIPPGTYTVEAWHEKFGTRTATVTIGERETATLALAFDAGQG